MMDIEITCLDKDGNFLGILKGSALPQHAKVEPPSGCSVSLSDQDLERLKLAFLRFDRAVKARQLVGDISLRFSGGGFEAAQQPDQNGVKLLAMEMRPFFLEKDPISFWKLLSLKSLGSSECIRPCLKSHRLRWDGSAFGGRMMIAVNNEELDTANVVKAWFNNDFFHTESQKSGELSLAGLIANVGGEDQAATLLAHHLIESLRVLGEFFNTLYAVSSDFSSWISTLADRKDAVS